MYIEPAGESYYLDFPGKYVKMFSPYYVIIVWEGIVVLYIDYNF
jgi:hypothetical protein